MIALHRNPEFLRCVWSQLRAGRALVAMIITAVLSSVVGYAMWKSYQRADPQAWVEWGKAFTQLVLGAQIAALALGGGAACLLAIQREKEMKTFDFQRVTRLTPLELALGKLFGAPVLAYWITLCLLPAAIVGAVAWKVRLDFFLAACLVGLLGSIAFHAFALQASLYLERGASPVSVLLLFLFFTPFLIGLDQAHLLTMGDMTPFAAIGLVGESTWTPAGPHGKPLWDPSIPIDYFFGQPIHHVPVLVVLYVTLGAWFLLGLVRNIKRDPSVYELYSPSQSVEFLLYLNVILLGFFNWKNFPAAVDAFRFLLFLNATLLAIMGLVLLRKRDQVRRRADGHTSATRLWWRASWPVPALLVGAVLTGAAALGLAAQSSDAKSNWNPGWAAFVLAYIFFWVARDILFLQWMTLRRLRRGVTVGTLYLIVFYTVTGILLGATGLVDKLDRVPVLVVTLPALILGLEPSDWTHAPVEWLGSLAVLALTGVVFAYLHRLELQRLIHSDRSPAAG